ncbi:MAG: hypothetical protein KAT11_00165 [Phycisphaerae bacterium]|nr:hypothetical protein [Phycisphaerae bacterium]
MNTDSEVTALLHELAQLGVSVRVEQGNLHISPRSRLTPDLTQRLKRHKAELIRALRLASLDEDQLFAWKERVAICEVLAGLDRKQSETVAWKGTEAQKRPPQSGDTNRK